MDGDKRQYSRIHKALSIQFLDTDKGIWNTTFIRDLSEGGTCFSSDESFSVGKILNLKIRLPSNPMDWTTIAGQIIESKPLTMGMYLIRLKFVELDAAKKKSLQDYISCLNKKGGQV